MLIKTATEKVNVSVGGRVATLELNRPEDLNALNKELIKDLICKLKEINDSDEIDVVVLTGKGEAFSAGGDMKWMISSLNESDFYSTMDCINELVVTLYGISKLTIAAVKGTAAGLGLSLALATDYIIADKSSKVALNFIDIGLIPDGGGHFFLEKRLGEIKSKQIIWEGKSLHVEEALQIGLIQEIAEGELQETLDVRISEWLKRPIQAMIKTKKILAEKNRPQLLKVLELEKHGQFKMRETFDHREGIHAFIEKRSPKFIGK